MPDRPYPSDLTDAEWAALEPLLPLPCRTGPPPKWSRRIMTEEIFYLVRSGCAWRMWPTPLPALVDGSLAADPLAQGRYIAPLARASTQPRSRCGRIGGRVHSDRGGRATARATGAGGAERGFDAGKKAFGRKRHILVDAAGLVLLSHVTAASLHDTVGAHWMVEAAPTSALPRLELVWADGAYTGPFAK